MAAGESSRVAPFGVTVHCVWMALECSAFLQCSKVLFPARGPVFSSPVWAPHNWGLCSLWSFSLFSIFSQSGCSCATVCGMTWIHLASQGPALSFGKVALELYMLQLWKYHWLRPRCSVQTMFHKYPCHKSWTVTEQTFICGGISEGVLENEAIVISCVESKVLLSWNCCFVAAFCCRVAWGRRVDALFDSAEVSFAAEHIDVLDLLAVRQRFCRGSAAWWNCSTVAALPGLPQAKRLFCDVIINLSTTLEHTLCLTVHVMAHNSLFCVCFE